MAACLGGTYFFPFSFAFKIDYAKQSSIFFRAAVSSIVFSLRPRVSYFFAGPTK
jgi:hypothetical protein